MGDLRRAFASFAKVYGIVVLLLGLVAFAVARVAKQDFIAFYQLLLVLMGIGYVFASVLAWTGFANIYRYSPTLYIGSHSYRQSIVRRDMAEHDVDAVFYVFFMSGRACPLLGCERAEPGNQCHPVTIWVYLHPHT